MKELVQTVASFIGTCVKYSAFMNISKLAQLPAEVRFFYIFLNLITLHMIQDNQPYIHHQHFT